MGKIYSKEDIKKLAGEALSEDESKERMLIMLTAFDTFCHQHRLKYWLSFGTLIGAIRHKGFIPWDDDADLVMPRRDYEILIKNKTICEGIDIVSPMDDQGYYHPFPYAKLSDNATISMIEGSNRNTGRGQFIDVFPLDYVPDDSDEREKLFDDLHRYQRLRTLAIRKYRKGATPKVLLNNCITFIMRPLSKLNLMRRIDQIAQRYKDKPSKKWGILTFSTKDTCIHDVSDYDETIRILFEGRELDVPAGFDSILRKSYGDYMQMPPEEQRIGKHDTVMYWKKH